MAVYIEHVRPLNPSGLRRYDSLQDAANGISRATHCGAGMILADLRSRGRFYYGSDGWHVVTARKMRERAVWAIRAADLMENGEDVSSLPD